MFVQSGGCCADVAVGEPEDFSLAAGDNLHFVTRSPACLSPGAPG